MSDCDGDGSVPFKAFAGVCKDFIDTNFKFEDQLKKAELHAKHASTITDKHPEG